MKNKLSILLVIFLLLKIINTYGQAIDEIGTTVLIVSSNTPMGSESNGSTTFSVTGSGYTVSENIYFDVAPGAPFTISITGQSGSYSTSQTFVTTSGSFNVTVNVKFKPTTLGIINSTINVSDDRLNYDEKSIRAKGTGPEIKIDGNSTEIVDGDNSPSSTDFTDFGTKIINSETQNRTITITNTETSSNKGNLILTDGDIVTGGDQYVVISGTNANQFSVISDATTPIAPDNATTTFTIQFAPTSSGVKTATLTILNNDPNEATYDFVIQGTGTVVAPDAPTTSAATTINQNSFYANWSAAGTGGTPSGYRLDVSTSETFASFVTGYNNLEVGNVTTYQVSGLSANTLYYFRVRGYNDGGTSSSSSNGSVTTAPSIPVANAASNIGNNSFFANWDPVSGATSYKLDVNTAIGFNGTAILTNQDVSGQEYYDVSVGLTGGTTYYYRVRSNNGNSSDNSNIKSVKTYCNAPTATAASTVTNNSFIANWSAPSGGAPTSYLLDVCTSEQFTSYVGIYQNLNVGLVTNYTVSGLSTGVSYYYRVRANNSTGASINSNYISATTTPSAPTATDASSVLSTSMNLNWGEVANATKYYICIGTTSGGTEIENDLDVGNVLTYNKTGLSANTTYYYKVKVDVSGSISTYSNIISQVLTPAVPTLSAASGQTSTAFYTNWLTCTGATTYYLDVSLASNFTSYVSGYQDLEVGNVLTYQVTGLSSNTTYYFRVRSSNGSGTTGGTSASPTSGQQTITMIAAPVASSSTLPDVGDFTANWNSVALATSYKITVSPNSDLSSPLADFQNINVGNVTTYLVDLGLTAGTLYYYGIRAVNANGQSDMSSPVSVKTICNAPTATTAGSITSSSFTANWSAPAVGGAPASYRLDVSTSDQFSSYVSGFQDKNVAAVLTYSVTGLSLGTTYYYRVRAVNSSGASTSSNIMSVTTTPNSPTATNASSVLSTSMNLNWGAVANATKYYICIGTTSGGTEVVNDLDVGNVLTYNKTGLSANTTYYYKVKVDVSGTQSAYSNNISQVTAPAVPTLSAASGQTSTSFYANWQTSTGATSYILDVSVASNFTSYVSGYQDLDVSNVLTYQVTGLASNTTYYYRVRATNGSGTTGGTSASQGSGQSTVTRVAASTATAASSITTASFVANWGSVSGATGYKLTVSTNSDLSSPLASYSNVNVNNVLTISVSSSISAGTIYYFGVRAYNANGDGDMSNIISTITVCAAPATQVANPINSTDFTANWSSVSGVADYRLDVATDASFVTKIVDNLTVSGTSQEVTGLSGNTNYYYRVRAVNASGTSGNSDTRTVTTSGASSTSWKSNASNTSWSDGNNWTNGVPSSTTDVTILAGTSQPLISTTITLKNLTIENLANLTLSSSGVLNITGNFFNDGSLTPNNSTVNFTGSSAQAITGDALTFYNLTINNSNGVSIAQDVTVNNVLTLTSGNFTLGTCNLTIKKSVAGTTSNLIAGATSSISIDGTTAGINIPSHITSLNNFTLNNSNGTTLQTDLQLDGNLTLTTGVLTIGANTLTLNGLITKTSGSLTGGSSSNITFGGAGATTSLPSITLNNLTVNRSNGISLSGDVTTQGTLSLQSGAFSIGANTLTVNGSMSISSGSITGGSSSNLSFGTSGSSVDLPAVTLNNLTVDRTNGVVLTGNLSSSGAVAVNGFLNCADFTVSGIGSFTVASGATLGIGSASGLNGNITVSGTKTFSTSGNYLYNGSVAQVTGTNLPSTIGSLEIANTHSSAVVSLSQNTTVSGAFTVSDGILEIPAGTNMTVDGNTSLTGTGLIIRSTGIGAGQTGSFISNGSVSGNATFEKYLTGGTGSSKRWWYFTSPISDATTGIFNGTGQLVKYHDETTAAYYTATNTSLQTAMKGHTTRFDDANKTFAFTGSLNTGTQSIGITFTNTLAYKGFNLVGNPYPSAIDWNLVDTTAANCKSSIWYRTTYSGTRNFATYNARGGVGTNGGQRYVPAMQGFWVRALVGGGNLQFTNSMRLHNSQAFYKQDEVTENILRLRVNRDSLSDETVIYFNNEANDSYDGFDSEKMFPTEVEPPLLYTNIPYFGDMVINGLQQLHGGIVVPLGFKTNFAGTFTINASQIESFPDSIVIILQDSVMKQSFDLREKQDYTFTSDSVNTLNRFRIKFTSSTVNGVNQQIGTLTEKVEIFASQNRIYFQCNDNQLIGSKAVISVYNITGSEIYNSKTQLSINSYVTLNKPTGAYLVKVLVGNKMFSKKVFVE